VTANHPMRSSLRLLAIAALPLALGACDWFTDFKSQPRIEPWEPLSQKDADTLHPPRGNPQFSVPVSGTAVAGYQVGYGAFPGVIDSIGRVATNPTPSSAASLENGRKLYSINCAVCHGDTGQGNGPAVQYGMAGISIINDRVKGLTDGYIYGMIRNGRGLMPPYNRIEEMERWDVVNYVRALQGTVANSAGVGPVGLPGQTGTALPGASSTAPTRPAPFPRPGGTPITPAERAIVPGGEGTTVPPGQAAPGTAPRDSAGRPVRGGADSLNATKRGTL
jgi:mono/diheme cytochrome c family protein